MTHRRNFGSVNNPCIVVVALLLICGMMMNLHSCWGLSCSNLASVVTRRNVVVEASTKTLAPLLLWNSMFDDASSASAATTTTTDSPIIVTDWVYLDVRISRPDGTFYVRDDEDADDNNRVFQTRLKLGLFGTIAPNHVEQFLKYVDSNPIVNDDDDDLLPSYARSMFSRYDDATGILYGGYIPGLQLTNFQGSSVLQYRGRLWPAKLWIENNRENRQPSSSFWKQQRRGLLTHAALDPTPVFGITTRESSLIDTATTTVFGQLQLPNNDNNDDSSSLEFLQRVSNLPTYSMDRPVPVDRERTVFDETAETVFAAQRQLFRNAAKSMGDTRLENVFPGKILRRIEVTRVGRL